MKIQFWPSDYFSGQIGDLTITSNGASGYVVKWLPVVRAYGTRLYVRKHATLWPTQDGTENGPLDAAYLVHDKPNMRAAFASDTSPFADGNNLTYVGAGTASERVAVIAVPYGRYGYIGTRTTASWTITGLSAPYAGAFTEVLRNLAESALGVVGTLDNQAYVFMTPSSINLPPTFRYNVKVTDADGVWSFGSKEYQAGTGTWNAAGTAQITDTAVSRIRTRLPFVDRYSASPQPARTMIGVSIHLYDGSGVFQDLASWVYNWPVAVSP